jgi:glycosyltransferase involved in cell wall biosynthesis
LLIDAQRAHAPTLVCRVTSITIPARAVGPDAPDLTSLRVLLVHDWIVAWGGAERTIEAMLDIVPQAELVVGVLGAAPRPDNAVTARARETWLARLPFARTHHRWYLPLYAAAFSSIDTRGFDLVISSSHAFAKSVRTPTGIPHICYCHTPPRYLWDLQHDYRRETSLAGTALALASPLLRRVDRASARHVDHFVANSQFVADRIRRCYGRDAAVVHPPVAPKPVSRVPARRTGALLSLGRLVPYKRVDLAIAAANALGEELIVAGDGPERDRLQRMAGPTVTFLGEVTEERAGELMESCRAMVFCAEEDFGIAPVEANAHGLPVIAYGHGAVRESLVDGVTAEFFDEPTVESLTEAIERAAGRTWHHAAIRANATRFSAQRFREEFTRQVRHVL